MRNALDEVLDILCDLSDALADDGRLADGTEIEGPLEHVIAILECVSREKQHAN